MIDKYVSTIEKMSRLQIDGNRKYAKNPAADLVKVTGSVLHKTWKLMQNRELSMQSFKDTAGMQGLELSIFSDYYIKKIFNKNTKVQVLKNTPCAKYQFDDFFDWYHNHHDQSRKFMYYLHLDDIHVNSIPYSYTLEDHNLIDEEMNSMKEYVDSLDTSYHGNILYDASIHHLDSKIHAFYDQLDKEGILDNTALVFLADHGFYSSYEEFRMDSIGNLHEENFHIPFIIYDRSSKYSPRIDKGIRAQRDIPYTLLQYFGIEPPKSFTGINMIETDGRKYGFIEYPGRGCPDVPRKTLYFSAFDLKYKICLLVNLSQNISQDMITEIYNKEVDYNEKNNLLHKEYDHQKADELYVLIKNRFEELKVEYDEEPWKNN